MCPFVFSCAAMELTAVSPDGNGWKGTPSPEWRLLTTAAIATRHGCFTVLLDHTSRSLLVARQILRDLSLTAVRSLQQAGVVTVAVVRLRVGIKCEERLLLTGHFFCTLSKFNVHCLHLSLRAHARTSLYNRLYCTCNPFPRVLKFHFGYSVSKKRGQQSACKLYAHVPPAHPSPSNCFLDHK